MMNWNLPVSFYFKVSFAPRYEKKDTEKPKPIGEVSFKKVSGFNSEIEQESIREGGLNTEYKLPKAIKYSNLKLEGAIMPINSELGKWLKETFDGNLSNPIKVCNVLIKLLNEKGEPLYMWSCVDAYPVKWEIGEFDALKNEVSIEVLELSYFALRREL